jgi:4-amino-4-deoxy-L-arabinose transferase-like glycosyltransferase
MMQKPTIIIILFVILGSIYAVTTPIFEASDELWHYPLVRHLADGNPLPVQDPNNVGPWKQEASQQPLYYYLAAALTFWIDTEDMESVRWLNPHVDNGILTSDGNTNLVIHQQEREAFPWSGTVLAVRLVRLLGVVMGAGTVYFTWRIANIVSPDRPELALGAAAVNAFTPMFLFISGAVNNDNLAMLLCAAALYLMLRSKDQSPRFRESLGLGIVLGFAALTKTSALGLVPLALVSSMVTIGRKKDLSWRQKAVEFLGHSSLLLAPIALIAGWWYVRNWRLYGDWLGWSAFIQVLGRRSHPASLRQLWGERWGFSLSYWGLFGGVNVPMPEWIYRVMNAAVVLAIPGLALVLVKSLQPKGATRGESTLASLVERVWPLALLGAWIVGILIGLVRWAIITWSSQGRLVFPAISAISVMLVAGLFGWLPQRKLSTWGVTLLGGFMLVISATAPFAWIAPAYRPPPAPDETAIDNAVRVEIDYGERIRLLGYDLDDKTAEPGDEVDLTLYWETVTPMERSWSVFVHLNDPVINAPIAQRDMYPGQGLLATPLLQPGQQLANRYVIEIPGTVYTPARVDLVVGWYDLLSGERLRTGDNRDLVRLTTIEIEPVGTGPYANPVNYNFEGKLALIGYRMDPRRLAAGETLELTLVWQALNRMEIDYTVFTHLRDLEDPSNRIFAQHDAGLPGGTTSWQQSQVAKVSYQLKLAEDTPAAVHEIEVGIYYQDQQGDFQRLQLLTPEGQLVDDFLILGKVRVD